MGKQIFKPQSPEKFYVENVGDVWDEHNFLLKDLLDRHLVTVEWGVDGRIASLQFNDEYDETRKKEQARLDLAVRTAVDKRRKSRPYAGHRRPDNLSEITVSSLDDESLESLDDWVRNFFAGKSLYKNHNTVERGGSRTEKSGKAARFTVQIRLNNKSEPVRIKGTADMIRRKIEQKYGRTMLHAVGGNY